MIGKCVDIVWSLTNIEQSEFEYLIHGRPLFNSNRQTYYLSIHDQILTRRVRMFVPGNVQKLSQSAQLAPDVRRKQEMRGCAFKSCCIVVKYRY